MEPGGPLPFLPRTLQGGVITSRPSPDGILGRAAQLTAALASDALDALGLRDRWLDADLRPLVPGTRLVGIALPVRVVAVDRVPAEPYTWEMRAIEQVEPGDVPIYEVPPDVRAALFGELFSLAARARGARGAIVDGRVRDVRQMAELGFPVFARGRSTLDTLGRAEVAAIGEPVVLGGVEIARGDVLVADDDGVVAVPAGRIEDVLAHVEEKVRGEQGARADILAGTGVRDVWERWRVF